MGDVTQSFKTALGKEFGKADAFKDNEGFDSYIGFRNSLPEGEVEEKWSEKYKKSIDCNNPKGFSQKAHCQSKQNLYYFDIPNKIN